MLRRFSGTNNHEVIVMADLTEFYIRMSINELVEYITGRKIIYNEQECARVLMKTDGIVYDYSDDEAMELFERFDTEELTCEQMSYHISLLFTLALHVEANNLESLSRSKRRLINYFRIEHADIYLDVPLPIETIKTIETFFEGQVATC